MPSLNLRSAGNVLLYISSLMLLTNMVDLTLADSLVNLIAPISSTNFTDQVAARYYSIPVTDDKGYVHDMIISTVSLDSWFATTTSTCPGTPNPDPACGWNPNALYDPTGASTNSTYCSIGVKPNPYEDTECYSIMPNRSITLGTNTAQNPDLQLHANVGLLINSTWDGSRQSGMLGLAATINSASTGPWNSLLDDMSDRYAQKKQFTLAFSRPAETGGWLTFGDTLPPTALPLNDPAVFQTPMESAVVNNRVNDLYVVTAGLAIVTAPITLEQYVIDSGDVYLRVPSATAQLINSAWNPAGTPMNDGTGRWSLPCNAEAPAIGLTISGHLFNIDKADMLWNQDNVCWSTVLDWQNGPYVLGWPLLNNVVVTFDLDNHIMYFQQPPIAHAPGEPSSSAIVSSAVPSRNTLTVIVTSTSTPLLPASTSLASTSTTAPATTPAAASPARSSTTRTQVSTLVTSPRPSSASVPTTAPAGGTTSRSIRSTTSAIVAPTPSQSLQSGTGAGTTTIVTNITSLTTVVSIEIVTASSSTS